MIVKAVIRKSFGRYFRQKNKLHNSSRRVCLQSAGIYVSLKASKKFLRFYVTSVTVILSSNSCEYPIKQFNQQELGL